MADSEYKVNIVVSTTDKTSAPAKKAAKNLDGLKQAAKALGVVMAAGVAVKYAAELVKVGAAAERQASSLENLAAAQGESGAAIIKAIQGASDFTIDRMSAMEAANKALVMDVAKTPVEFERLTKVAVALGRAMGQDATKSIDDFVTASARQSQMIADNLGLTVTVGQATERYAAVLGVTADELTDAQKKQAFLNEMLVQGEAKMAQLGDQSLDSAGKIEQVETAWTDARLAISEAAAAVAHTTGILDKVSTGARRWSADVSIFADAMKRLREGASLKESLFDVEPSDIAAINSATLSYTAMARAEAIATQRTSELSSVSDEYKAKLNSQVVSQGMMEHTILATAEAIRREGVGSNSELEAAILAANTAAELSPEAYAKQAEAAAGAAQATAGLAASLKDATDAQIAQAAISELGQALQEGQIDADVYAQAVQETQLAFGLADEQSIFLTDSLAGLTEALASGAIEADGYDEALGEMIAQSMAAGVEVETFANALDGLPKEVTIDIVTRYTTEGTPPSDGGGGGGGGDIPQFAHGGSFMVGEAGAEMVTVQPVGRGGDSIYNDTFNVYDGNSMAAVQENRRRQRRGGIARTM